MADGGLAFEVVALRYAHRAASRCGHFIGGDPHDGPMRMDYFVRLMRNDERAMVVDVGFADTVLTHLHRDHVGNLAGFPAATFDLQETQAQASRCASICRSTFRLDRHISMERTHV